jgi:hypothetical protein
VSIEAAAEPKTIGGVAYRVAHVKSESVRDLTLYFAPDGALARMDYVGQGPTGPSRQTEVFSDWRSVGAVKYPYARRVLIDGERYLEGRVTRVTFGAPIDDSAFKKPGS